MYQQPGYFHTFALQQINDLLTAFDTGVQKQPVTGEENKKAVLDSIKELEKMSKDFAINEMVETNLARAIQEDITEAEQTKNIEKLLVPIEQRYQLMRAEAAGHENQLQTLKILKEHFTKTKKAVKDGKERPIENGDDDEDEIISETAVVRMKDPISKERITEPVRNVHCAHVYNRPTILAFIRENADRRMLCQCPQPGCQNKRSLVAEDIEDYPEFFETAVLER